MSAENRPLKPYGNGRGSDGRFVKGCAPGPGNPNIRRAAELHELLTDWTTKTRLRKIWQKVLDLAEEGDLQAAKLVLDRVVGQCKPAPEPLEDRIDQIDVVVSVQRGGLSDQELLDYSDRPAEAPGQSDSV